MNKHQVALRLELADDLPPALGDKVLLQQVILNLILNGIDAMNTVEDRSRDLMLAFTEPSSGSRRISKRTRKSERSRPTKEGVDASLCRRLFAKPVG
jgi:signal transduction histidine kinase